MSDAIVSPASEEAPTRTVDTRVGLGTTTIAGGGFAACWGASIEPGHLAVVNLTPVRATAWGWGELDDGNNHLISHVNFGPGTIDPNVAVSGPSPDGQLCFRNDSAGPVDLVVDSLVVIVPAAIAHLGPPRRILDTRAATPVAANACPTSTRCYSATGTIDQWWMKYFFLSDDAGVTWRRARSAPSTTQSTGPSEFVCDAPTHCWYLTTYRYGGAPPPELFVTVDGETWRYLGFTFGALACPAPEVCLALSGSRPEYFTGPQPQARLTTNAGRTWRAIELPPLPEYTYFVELDCGVASCVASTANDSSPSVSSDVTFATTDGWVTATVTVDEPTPTPASGGAS